MNEFTATEIAYKNGYNQALTDFAERMKTEFHDCWYFGRDVAERRIDQIAKEIERR